MDILEQGLAAQARAMRDFGYSGVSKSDVRKYHANWLKNSDQVDIVARFCESAFEEHPEIFGTRDSD